MSSSSPFFHLFSTILKKRFSTTKHALSDKIVIKKILLVRQHNQFGDLLANVPLFRALKLKYPECQLSIIVSPANKSAVEHCRYINDYFVFDKKKLFRLRYLKDFKKYLNKETDIVIVPVTVSLSFTSNFISRLAKAKYRLGAASLDGELNREEYFFNKSIDLNWKKFADAHVSDFAIEIVRPLGISHNDFKSDISFDRNDLDIAKQFIKLNFKSKNRVIGIHPGAGKPQNRWSVKNYLELAGQIRSKFQADIYFTGSKDDKAVFNEIRNNIGFQAAYFLDQSVSALAALISISTLFVSNDTGVMHVAGTTDTPQISLFGPTNPFNWAPIGKTKYFLQKSDNVEDIPVGEVLRLMEIIFFNSQL